jgi:hypothetical protein
VLEVAAEAGVLRVDHGQGLAGRESDQAAFGRGVDGVDPLALCSGQDPGLATPLPDDPAVVAAGDDAVAGGMERGAQDGPVMGGAEL